MTLEEAIKLVKAAGYTVSKPRTRKLNHVGPTFVAHWSDGVITRMSIHTTDEKPDLERALLVSLAAYESRTRRQGLARIVEGRFERAGNVLRTYDASQLNGGQK